MALAAMGRVRSLEFRNAEAVDWFRRSLAVNPSNASVINWLHNELMYTGNYSESTRLAVKGAQVDPMSRIALHVAAVAMARELDGEERDITVMIERLDQIDPAWAQMTRGDIARERGALVDAVRHYQQALRRDPDLYRAREVLAAQLLAWDLAAEAGAVDSNFDEFYIAYHSGNWPRALALAQARFEASPQDIDSVVNLALTLRSAGRWEEALQLGLIVWEAIGRNPHRWPPDELISVAWGGALTERPAVREQFVIATRTVLDSVESAGQRGIWYHFDLAEAMLAALEGRYGEGVRHLAAAVDRGFRDLREAEGVMLAPLAGDLGYREQLDRMQRLIAEERSQVLDLVCGDGGLLAQQRNLADVCLRP